MGAAYYERKYSLMRRAPQFHVHMHIVHRPTLRYILFNRLNERRRAPHTKTYIFCFVFFFLRKRSGSIPISVGNHRASSESLSAYMRIRMYVEGVCFIYRIECMHTLLYCDSCLLNKYVG